MAQESRLAIDVIGMDFSAPKVQLGSCVMRFCMFPHLKEQLPGTHYQCLDNLDKPVTKYFHPFQGLVCKCFQKMGDHTRHKHCVEHQGLYFEKEKLSSK